MSKYIDSGIITAKKIPGNRRNFNRDASIEVYEGGYVRIQQPGDPVDVCLLTLRQVREITRLAEAAVTP